jgi:hypothetical protein
MGLDWAEEVMTKTGVAVSEIVELDREAEEFEVEI